MSTRIARVEAFVVTLPRDTPYLGPAAGDEPVNARGYLVRKGNRTIYPVVDRSILLKLTTDHGLVGWGETYGLVAPDAVTAILDDVIGPFVVGRDPGVAGAVEKIDRQRRREVRAFVVQTFRAAWVHELTAGSVSARRRRWQAGK